MDINFFKRFKKKQPLPDKFNTEFAFEDLKGNRYYKFVQPNALPLERYAKSIDILLYMSAGVTSNELITLVERGELEMENLVTGKRGSLSKIGVIFNELKMRAGLIVHHELMYQLMAVYYLIEGENPSVVNDELNDQKITNFKDLVKEKGEYDFFQVPELSELNRKLFTSQEEFQQSWNESIRVSNRTKKILEYLKSEEKSEKEERTSRAN